MSSSSVCQGFQSHLEPRVMAPRVLSLKLAPQGSNVSPSSATVNNSNRVTPTSDSESQQQHHQEKPLTNHECDKNDTIPNSGWCFLQALTNKKTEEDQVYVHPTVKRSSSVLTEQSLQMCTESLGSETGSNASDNIDDISLFSSDTNTFPLTQITTTTIARDNNTSFESRRVNRACNFPPPLTSITDFGGVHVMPRREGGRLIMEAFPSPSPRRYFHAERGDGRLRLCLFESYFSAFDVDDEVCDGEEEGAAEEEEEDDSERNREEAEEGEEEGEEEEGEEEEEEETGAEEENVDNVEDEMGVKKFARPSRCKESGRDIFGDALATLSLPLFLSVHE
ncbi:hypothetical protein RJT34_20133 [Clitoria ternatea]|uniref:FAF domain-containing protein n=1 Tax=Clitoria ternatea TaxID=43366 RepID=A0AAN9P5F5_CLITE